MATTINKVILVGYITRDPEIRTTPQGTPVASLTLYTAESYKDKSGNWQKNADYTRVVLWDYLADTVSKKGLKDGDKVYIEGKLKTRSYEKDGVTRYITEVIANQLIFFDTNNSENYEGGGSPSYNQESKAQNGITEDDLLSEDDDDDIPF